MKKAALFTSSALLTVACAAPVSTNDEGGEMVINGGDGDTTMTNTGGTTAVVPGGPVTGTGGTGAPVAGTGGTAPIGTGSAPAVGTGGTAPVGGGTVTCTGAATVNGYVDNGSMCGFAWTGSYPPGVTAPTFEPPCAGGTCFEGADVCMTASIPAETASPAYYPGAMIGWNVQQSADGATTSTWTTTGAGLTPTFTAMNATGATRVVVKVGTSEYCAPATSGVAIPWTDFKVGCWDQATAGPAIPTGSAVSEVMLQVNSAPTAQEITLCLTSIVPN